MNGIPWETAAAVFAISFAGGLVAFLLLGRRRPKEAIRLFDPPPAGAFRVLKVEVFASGTLTAVPLGDFATMEEASEEALRLPMAAAKGVYRYYTVVDSAGASVLLREP